MIQDFQIELYIIKLIDNLKYQYKFGNEYNIGSITNQSTIHGKVKYGKEIQNINKRSKVYMKDILEKETCKQKIIFEKKKLNYLS